MRGEKSVQFADRGLVRRSYDELKLLEDQIIAALNAAPTVIRRSKQSRLVASKGFNPPVSTVGE